MKPKQEKTISCRSEEGVTIGLIDSIISISRVLSKRKFNTKQIKEALADLRCDEDLQNILNTPRQHRHH
jgi:hypothetical protein